MERLWTKGLLLWVGVAVLVLAVGLTGCGGGSTETEEGEPQEEIIEEVRFIAPLTGDEVEDEELTLRRPVALVLGNDPTIGPQSGLSQAAWVVELPVEGGITRLMAVFQHHAPAVVGPVRSARPVFLDRTLEFGAALGHVGYSPLAKREIPQLGVISLNEFGSASLYYRVSGKRAPHNLYTDTNGLFAELEGRGLDKHDPQWDLTFLEPEEVPAGNLAKKIRIHYPLGVVEYQYDEGYRGYLRSFRGQPSTDAETGEQLVAANVIIQEIKRPRVVDSEGRLDVQTTGTGQAKVFQRGVGLESKWQKHSRDSWTAFLGWDDKPVPLAVGQTWVQVVAEGTRVEVE